LYNELYCESIVFNEKNGNISKKIFFKLIEEDIKKKPIDPNERFHVYGYIKSTKL